MLKIENIDFEFATINKQPQFGYVDEFKEYDMLSKKKRRHYFGKRFTAVFSYAYLTDEQIAILNNVLNTQRVRGYVTAEMSTPSGDFRGNVNIEIKNAQTRFAKIDNKWVWTNYQIQVQGVDLL